MMLAAGLIGGLIGLGAGYLTLRLRGVYFAIATLAMAIVLETVANNWAYVGGASGAYILTPDAVPFFDDYIEFLFALMLLLGRLARSGSRAHLTALADRPGPERDPGRRDRGRMHGRADAAA